MAKRVGQIVQKTLVTPDTNATFPVVDCNDLGGGRHIVASITERDKIPFQHLQVGMTAFVQDIDKEYKLISKPASASAPLTSVNWEDCTVPKNALTAHNTVEEIQYGTPTVPDGYTTLLQKLNAIDTALASKLSAHQKVEDIQFQNTTQFATLVAKLADMDSKIGAAAGIPTIEQLSWATGGTPTGHEATLAGELTVTMNNPSKIMVTYNSASVTLQAALNSIEAHTHTLTDVHDSSNVTLDVLLQNASDADKIKVNNASGSTPAQVSLNQRFSDLDTTISTLSSNLSVEKLNWSTTPAAITALGISTFSTKLSDNIIDLYTRAVDINDPTKINVPDGSGGTTTLAARITALNTIAASSTQSVEDITWKTTPTTPSGITASLSDNIKDLFTAAANINDPTKINIPNGSGGTDPLTTVLANMNDPSKITVVYKGTSTTLNVVAGKINDPAEIQIADGTDGSGNPVYTTLANKIAALTTAIANSEPPQNFLFTSASPAIGTVNGIEYMTQSRCQVTEICFGTNIDASLTEDIVFDLEIADPSSSSYGALLNCKGLTLAKDQAGKYVRTDMTSLNVFLDNNTRVRVRITSLGTSDVIATFDVRVTVQKATTGSEPVNQLAT